jgi:catechol 1,2-dioxygenase
MTARKFDFDHNFVRFLTTSPVRAGHILKALDRSPTRPAHIHFLVRKEGYRELITQVYDGSCQYLDKDSVFGVKTSQIVEFKKIGDGKTELEV